MKKHKPLIVIQYGSQVWGPFKTLDAAIKFAVLHVGSGWTYHELFAPGGNQP